VASSPTPASSGSGAARSHEAVAEALLPRAGGRKRARSVRLEDVNSIRVDLLRLEERNRELERQVEECKATVAAS